MGMNRFGGGGLVFVAGVPHIHGDGPDNVGTPVNLPASSSY